MRESIKVGQKKQIEGVMGIDVGDRWSHLCGLDMGSGDVVEESRVRTTPEGVRRLFAEQPCLRIALRRGSTHRGCAGCWWSWDTR